ncbi:pleckstrin homology domain-containing family A member 5-like isoform X7 [Epinephelus fuscoguttatus]|uniref:pleckstrin homology domain-containing family A member 5-like isoform X7 n=1 Tax=Epinephelus fuscoguttatus TaxID=293821 RepID=UPI0020D0111B|nr:pleckstrin homology domain-containing family A member 5-like isoform X7 [Epinephelus fuscoguttatus]
MAADPKPDWLSSLPSSWSYGVTRDGRIFFINEEAKSTTWLHPVTGEAVITGHRKTPDLPTGWEEGYTFEGARCFINHNERKVTCKHPVSGVPSQDNCIFVVNEHVTCGKLVHPDKPIEALSRPAPKTSSEQGSSSDKKERPMSTMSEASNYTGGSDYSTFPGSPATTITTATTTTSTSSTRPSRSFKKVHNFGKRSNSIKRNPNAPVVKSNWLYKQDSTGMKLWKKRWFVLSDMCLFYYRDEKEDSILGSILLPSFHISMLSVDDHISRKYAFKATHPNMRTYYFCTDTAKEMESWMKVMTDAALVHTEPVRSVTSYQTLPRNMPSHRAQIVPRYPEGYRTLPRNSMMRPDSICSVAGSVYDRALRPASTNPITTAEKRKSMRDDTMWQLYEWQQRQAFSRQSLAQPTAVSHYGTLPSTKTMGNISEHAVALSIPTSPSHGSLALYSTFSPRQQVAHNPSSTHSEVSSPVFKGDVTLDHRHRTHPAKYGYPSDRRSIAAGVPPQTITPQSLQGKTPEELTLLLIKLRRQQAELNSLREHTVAQLMALGMEGPNAKTDVLSHHLQRNLIYLDSQMKENEPLIFMIHTMIENSAPRPQLYQQISPEDYKDSSFIQRNEEADIDTKLSRLCEQDKAVRMQEEKLQQLHREKHTLETALLSASQELSEQSSSNAAATQSLIQQRDVLQNGLLSTCRELSRVNTELERSWREYDRLGADVTLAKSNLLEQLEALGSPQTEPPSQRHIQIQKELWRIQDVMEALAKNKPQRSIDSSLTGSKPLSSLQKNEAVTLLPLSPLKEGDSMPPRPPLPQYYDSSEHPPHVPPHHSHPGGRQPPHTHRTEDRKASSRNGVHSQAPDYRLYKSEPELTTVKEEVDEANTEDKDKTETSVESKDTASLKAPPYPVGIIQPRTKSPMSPPESSTIASYVTLRKTKKPESRADRPRSAVDQTGFGEREVGRTRMSVEEQLERIRRNQEASSLREKRRETPSRSPSFSKDNPFLIQQSRIPAEGACADPVELEAALQQLRAAHMEQSRMAAEAAKTHTEPAPQELQRVEEVKKGKSEEVQQDRDMTPQTVKELQVAANRTDNELCESQRVVILDLGTDPKHVEIVNLHPFEDDESREQDLTSSPTNTTTENSFQTPEPDTPSPEPKEEEPDLMQQTTRKEKLENRVDSTNQLTADDKKHNNNNLLASQTFTLVRSDT